MAAKSDVRAWMARHAGEFVDECDEVNATKLAEEAAAQFGEDDVGGGLGDEGHWGGGRRTVRGGRGGGVARRREPLGVGPRGRGGREVRGGCQGRWSGQEEDVMIKVTTRGLGFGGQVMLWQRTGEPVRDAYLDVVGAIDCYEYYHDAAQGEYRRQQYVYAGEDHELHCLGLGLAVGPLSMSMIVDDLAASLGDVERRWWLSARQDVVALGRAMAVAGLAPWFAGIRDRRGPREAGRQLALAVGRLVHHLRGTRLQRVRGLMGTVPRG